MILEHAILNVIPGREGEFEGAFEEAQRIIASMPGFVSLQLHRGVEQPSRYLLLVEWERLEDHTEGFRKSPEYEQWKALLHHFYDPFPEVEHFQCGFRKAAASSGDEGAGRRGRSGARRRAEEGPGG